MANIEAQRDHYEKIDKWYVKFRMTETLRMDEQAAICRSVA